jgi:hypothetical protein
MNEIKEEKRAIEEDDSKLQEEVERLTRMQEHLAYEKEMQAAFSEQESTELKELNERIELLGDQKKEMEEFMVKQQSKILAPTPQRIITDLIMVQSAIQKLEREKYVLKEQYNAFQKKGFTQNQDSSQSLSPHQYQKYLAHENKLKDQLSNYQFKIGNFSLSRFF